VTATSFVGSGANLTGVSGVSTTGSVNTSGIITATSIVVSAGTAADPSISPTGDSNTGIFFPSADTIAFGEGGAEAMRVDSSGRLLIGISTSGNANGGKLQLSGGITFPATQVAASDANTLDDYEEGSWTPVVSNTGYTYTYSNQTGTYTKVGRTVTLSWRVAVTARSGSASGGLPLLAIPLTPSASFTGSALMNPQPAQLVIHKAATGATSGVRTFLYSGLANGNTSYFWIGAVATDGDPFDIGSDFHMGGVFTYEV